MSLRVKRDEQRLVPESSSASVAEAARVEQQSAQFKKELGLVDLVLQQIVYVVGIVWVGAAAKLGQSHIGVLARGDAALLSAASGGGDSSQPRDAARGRPLSVDEAWLRRSRGIHGRVEPLDVRGGAHWKHRPRHLDEPLVCVRRCPGWRRASCSSSAISCTLMALLMVLGVLGLGVSKWLHNAGSMMLLIAFVVLIGLPFVQRRAGYVAIVSSLRAGNAGAEPLELEHLR